MCSNAVICSPGRSDTSGSSHEGGLVHDLHTSRDAMKDTYNLLADGIVDWRDVTPPNGRRPMATTGMSASASRVTPA